jgi:predicted transposase
MTTIKLKYQANNEFFDILKNIRKQYSSVLRFSYNRILEDTSQIDIRKQVKLLKNVDLINAWIKQSAI